jgi:hypothetical protein
MAITDLSLFDQSVQDGQVDKYQQYLDKAKKTARSGLITEATTSGVMTIIVAFLTIKIAINNGITAAGLAAVILIIVALAASLTVDGLGYTYANKELNLFNSSKDLIENAINVIKLHMSFDDLKNISDKYANIFGDKTISPVYKINQAVSLINSLSNNFYADVLELLHSLSELMLKHGTDLDNFIKTLNSDFMHNINGDTANA